MIDEGTALSAESTEICADQLASFNLSDAEAQDEDKKSTSLPDDEDPELWKPHPTREEYPVCLVPLPLANVQASNWSCCGMVIPYVRLANKRTGELEPLQTEREQRSDYRRWRNTNAVRSVECQFLKLTQNASNDYRRRLTKVILRPCSL